MRAILKEEKRSYVEFRKCEMCGDKFIVRHKLRRYCDKCRP